MKKTTGIVPAGILVVLLLFPFYTFSQSDTLRENTDTVASPEEAGYVEEDYVPYAPPPLDPMQVRPVEKSRWTDALRSLDYSKDKESPPEEQKQEKDSALNQVNWTAATQWLGSLLQALAILLAVAGIVYGIYRMLKAPKNRVIARDGVEITLENLEEYLHETDLERFLREALEKGDYPLVIRLYYLQIIKSLSEKNAIRWSKEKTNRDYLRETREHRMGEQFRIVTRTYERVWYGNQSLTLHEFGRIEPQFKNLIASL